MVLPDELCSLFWKDLCSSSKSNAGFCLDVDACEKCVPGALLEADVCVV